MRRRARLAVPGALLAALLAVTGGCGAGDSASSPATAAGATTGGASDGTSSAEPSTDGSPTAGSTADDEGSADPPQFPADVSADTADPSPDAAVTVRDIRIGRHDGFDRVVFEVGGTGTPGWDVRYVDEASSQGSGERVEVAGDAVLQVSITGAGYPYDTGVEEYSGPDPLSAADTGVATEVVFDATFEGTTVAFVGTKVAAPFRVYLLEAPTRVVLEIRHSG